MTDRDATAGAGAVRRRYPISTVALMIGAVALPLVLLFSDLLLPGVLDDHSWLGTVFWFGPPALLALGAISAPMHGSVSVDSRLGWAAASGSCAVLWIPVLWFAGVLIFGP